MLTAPLHQTLVFIIAYQAEHGGSPTQEEIMRGVGLTAKSSVCHRLRRLQERGYIWHEKCAMREIAVLRRPPVRSAVFIPVIDGEVSLDQAQPIQWP